MIATYLSKPFFVIAIVKSYTSQHRILYHRLISLQVKPKQKAFVSCCYSLRTPYNNTSTI